MRPDFDRHLNDAMLSAFSTLQLSTAQVLQDKRSEWTGPGDPDIVAHLKTLVKKFEDASTIIRTDLTRIAESSQQWSEKENEMKSLNASLRKHKEDLRVDRTDNENNADRESRRSGDINRERMRSGVKELSLEITYHAERARIYSKRAADLAKCSNKVEGFLTDTEAWVPRIGIDENRLIRLKEMVYHIWMEAGRLENRVSSPTMRFGPHDFIRCVLELLRSKDMTGVEKQVGQPLVQKRQDIVSSCKGHLSSEDWAAVQQPYVEN